MNVQLWNFGHLLMNYGPPAAFLDQYGFEWVFAAAGCHSPPAWVTPA